MAPRPQDPTKGNDLAAPRQDAGAAGFSGNGVPGPGAQMPPQRGGPPPGPPAPISITDPYTYRTGLDYNRPGTGALGPDGLTNEQRTAMYANAETNPWQIGASAGMTYDPDVIFGLLKRASQKDPQAIAILRAIDLQPGEQVEAWAQRRKLDQYAGQGARSAYYHDPLNASPDQLQRARAAGVNINPYSGEGEAQNAFGWWNNPEKGMPAYTPPAAAINRGPDSPGGNGEPPADGPRASYPSAGGSDAGPSAGPRADRSGPPNLDQRMPAASGPRPENDVNSASWFKRYFGG